MEQKLLTAINGHFHWCPGCERMHNIPPSWQFDGNYQKPSFWPSIKIEYNGQDADHRREDGSRAPARICHYFVIAGEIRYQPDCTHEKAGQVVPLEDLSVEPRIGSKLG